jgi:hypothetical protein
MKQLTEAVFPYTKQRLIKYKNGRAIITRTHGCCVLVFLLKPETYFNRGDFTHSPGYTPLLKESLIQKVQGGGLTPAKYIRTTKGESVRRIWLSLNCDEQKHDYDQYLHWVRNYYVTKPEQSLVNDDLLPLCDKLLSFCFILKGLILKRIPRQINKLYIPRDEIQIQKHVQAWRMVLELFYKTHKLPEYIIFKIFYLSGHRTYTFIGKKGFFSKFPQQKIIFLFY